MPRLYKYLPVHGGPATPTQIICRKMSMEQAEVSKKSEQMGRQTAVKRCAVIRI